ncbi:MAG TPA: hypothetical protein VFW35_02470 [Sphingomicrobium sp.]|nr:hypothetical protein [Sphingomicrobium sp.]
MFAVTWAKRYGAGTRRVAPGRRAAMAKGQQRSNKEARKPKKAKVKTNASNPSQKGGSRGLENLEHLKNS